METIKTAPVITPIHLPGTESNILAIKAQIAKLQRILKFEEEMKSHIENINENGLPLALGNSDDTVTKHPRKLGEFILSHLKKNSKVDTKDIIKAYAVHVHDNPENVRNNVSNALTRLKSDSKVKNKPNPGGRRYGSKWSLTKTESN